MYLNTWLEKRFFALHYILQVAMVYIALSTYVVLVHIVCTPNTPRLADLKLVLV